MEAAALDACTPICRIRWPFRADWSTAMRLSRIVWLNIVIGLVCGLMWTSPTRAAGLLAPTEVSLPPLRVTEHMVDVTIRDQIALTTLNQTFRNDTGRQLEATYVFPLPENAELT